MNDIQRAIHEKKEEIKKANRELSKLQDELKNNDEPRMVHVIRSSVGPESDYINGIREYELVLHIKSNKRDLNDIDFLNEADRAIESLSDKPKDDRCYVNWDKVPHGYDWVAVDGDGRVCAYNTKPDGEYCDCMWCVGAPGDFCIDIKRDAIIGSLPPWRDSLIHRPGVKE